MGGALKECSVGDSAAGAGVGERGMDVRVASTTGVALGLQVASAKVRPNVTSRSESLLCLIITRIPFTTPQLELPG